MGAPSFPNRLALGVILGVAFAPPLLLPSLYPDQPPLAHTGGFGEPTCQRCHFGAPLNAPGGTLTLSRPDSYQPGRTYQVRVELERPDMRRAGFQLAVRFSEGGGFGRQAGVLRGANERFEVLADSTGIQYAQHRHAGSALPRPGHASWTIDWTAPGAREPVAFHLVGNAANDDASEFGDFIYAGSTRVLPGK